ncbi:GAF domain-containing protein [Fulvivirga ligni]|uniref:GAF domain-containing protein n=1 Tax=Fulvivirga ligni TaxID=2904246 RepID=UPI001F3E76C6|nr:GAF domain-containing protein [Fulvivirga ligni]UII22924.1 GAF domain-containing protein [Fulvivirga ligni]
MKRKDLKTFFDAINKSSDKVIETLLSAYLLFGIFLAIFYDTWLIALTSGPLILALYFVTKLTFPNKTAHHYVASLGLGIFMAQFIYQMHGLFEMHFTAFLAISIMVFYRNWKLFIPIVLFVVVHHASFAYIQFIGLRDNIDAYRNIYFTQLDYMDLQTFLFHAGLYAIYAIIMGYHAYQLHKDTVNTANNIIELEKEKEIIQENIQFANAISNGNYDTSYDLKDGDHLGEALLHMKKNLQESAQREKQDKFLNVGLAEVSEIIRNSENQEQLSDELISYLVKYLNANQGGVFIKTEEHHEVKLILKGCYAYERKKHFEKEIIPGQGLVGQCFQEQQFIHLTDIPDNYLNITSGLGKANPNTIIIIPLIYNENVEGVIELASFHKIEKYQIDFLLKIGQSIGSAISNVRTAEITSKLYSESKEQAEQLRSQEEEMRQNMEELSATQEEMQRNSKEMEETLTALNSGELLYMELDHEGKIKQVNTRLASVLSIEGRFKNLKYNDLVDSRIASSGDYQEFWSNLRTGREQRGTFTLHGDSGNKLILKGSFNPIFNNSGRVSKIILSGHDVTAMQTLIDSLEKLTDNKQVKDLLSSVKELEQVNNN